MDAASETAAWAISNAAQNGDWNALNLVANIFAGQVSSNAAKGLIDKLAIDTKWVETLARENLKGRFDVAMSVIADVLTSETAFTGSLGQLDSLNLSVNDHIYQAVVDYAYNEVAEGLGDNQVVGWSPDLGYHAVEIDDACSYDYW